jgi:hypothetical protein
MDGARILISGSRSLDERRYDATAPPTLLRSCREARAAFLRHLEDAIANLAVSDLGLRPVVVVHGGAHHGADNWADRWLYWAWDSRKFSRDALHVERWDAKWKRDNGSFNRGAGMMRNGEMVASMDATKPHLVLVAWDGQSSGAKNLLDRATEAGLTIERTWL